MRKCKCQWHIKKPAPTKVLHKGYKLTSYTLTYIYIHIVDSYAKKRPRDTQQPLVRIHIVKILNTQLNKSACMPKNE